MKELRKWDVSRPVYSCLWTEAVTRSLFQNDVLKTFANFKRKHLYRSLILKNVGGFNSGTLTNKKLRHRYFPVHFSKIFKNSYINENFWNVSSAWTIHGATKSYIQETTIRKQHCSFILNMDRTAVNYLAVKKNIWSQ